MPLVATLASACSAAPADPATASSPAPPQPDTTIDIPAPATAAPTATATPSVEASSAPPTPEPFGSDLLGLKGTRIQNTKVMSEAVLMATELWQMSHPLDCPGVDDLVKDRVLVPSNEKDPWGERFRIRCSPEGNRVVSTGPDQLIGTRDDIETLAKP